MSRMGKADFSEFRDFVKKVEENLGEEQVEAFVEACAKELTARLLTKVIRRTPVGDYTKEVEVIAKRDSKNHKKGDTYKKSVNPSGKQGGTLRRGWTAEKQQNVTAYVNSLNVICNGDTYTIEIINPVEYASYVEFGHRTRNHKGWVEGRFMLTLSSQEIQQEAPKIIENKLKKKLGEAFK